MLYIEPALASASASLPPQTSTKKVDLLAYLTLLWHGYVRSQSIRFSCFGPATPQREHCGDNENLFKLQVEHPSLRPLRGITSTGPAASSLSLEGRSITIAPLKAGQQFFSKNPKRPLVALVEQVRAFGSIDVRLFWYLAVGSNRDES